MLPWLIYTRVSTDDQAQSGVSLAMQEAQCRAMATATGVERVEVVVDDGYSGKDLKRPGMQRLLAAIESRAVAGIIVWKLDRLTRSLRDLLALTDQLKAADVALVSLHEKIDTSGPMGRFTLHLMGALAQLERETIATRVKAAIDHIRAKGGWTGGTVPPGCRRAGERGNFRLEVDPATAPVVRAAFAAYVDGASLAEVAVMLQRAGVFKSKRSPSNIAGMLRNEGLVSVGVIDAALQAQAVEICESRARSKGKPAAAAESRSEARAWPLHGLAFCGKCGSALIGATANGRGGKAWPYLRCAGRNRRICDMPELPAEAWERAVVRAVTKAAADGSWTAAWSTYASEQLTRCRESLEQRQGLITERGAINARIRRLLSLVEDGSATGAQVKERMATLDAEHKAADRAIAELDGVQVAVDLLEQRRAFMADRLVAAVQQLPTTTPEAAGAILGGIVQRVVLSVDPATIRLDLYVPGRGGQGFDSESQMVEAEGIEPSSEHVRTPLLRV